MSNSIRTPRQGKSKTSRRIAAAVDDEEWQQFRLSLKGMDTQSKINNLREYYLDRIVMLGGRDDEESRKICSDVCTRVDNYLKALARGGQLEKGVSLEQALAWDWNFKIRK
jgi:hypothetical protein